MHPTSCTYCIHRRLCKSFDAVMIAIEQSCFPFTGHASAEEIVGEGLAPYCACYKKEQAPCST